MYNLSFTQSIINYPQFGGFDVEEQPKCFFTWKITNAESLDETIFYAENLSDNPDVYNTFVILISTTMSAPDQGIINEPTGDYIFQIYQMPDTQDLDLNRAIKEVAVGDLKITN